MPHVRKQLDPKSALGLRIHFAFILIAAVVGFGAYWWRLTYFDRAVATIEDVWIVEKKAKSKPVFLAFAELTFTRVTPQGEAVDCRQVFHVGYASDNLKVGDKLLIVPARGTCQRINNLGRIDD